MFFEVLKRELLIAWRRPGDAVLPVAFFLVVAVLFPLGLLPDPRLLRPVAPGIVWVLALLAGLLGQQAMFRSDRQDGTLEQFTLSPRPLVLVILAKSLGQWLLTGLPVIAASALIGSMLYLSGPALGILVLSLCLGTPILTLLGAMAAALTVSLRQASVLGPILVLPLATPILIFGAHSATLVLMGRSPVQPLWALAALLLLAISLLPAAAALALRISLE